MNESRVNQTIQRHKSFWDLERVQRPLIGVQFGVDLLTDNWCPVYRLDAYDRGSLRPEMVIPEDHSELYHFVLNFRDNIIDDTIPVLSPLSSIPWMEAFVGCDLVISSEGRVWAEYREETLPEIDGLRSRMTDSNPWLKKYYEFIEMFNRHFPDYPVGQPLFRGPTDLMGVFCGSTGHILNLYDRPDYMRKLLRFCEEAFIWFAGKTLEATPPFRGGYWLGTYNLWAPEKCVRFQEDFTSLYSPDLYAQFILETDRRISEAFPYNLFHMHTSQLPLFHEYLKNSKLRVVQLTRDIDEKKMSNIIEAAQQMQQSNKAVLLRGAFSEADLEEIRTKLSPVGLYLQNVLRLDELNKLAEKSRSIWS